MKRPGCCSSVLIIVLVLGGIITFALGYFNIVPEIAEFLGTNTPRDLGVTYSAENLQSFRIKTATTVMELPADSFVSVAYTGASSIDTPLTQEELTAAANSCEWVYCPVEDLQIKINPDGKIEISGMLISDRLAGYASAMGFGLTDIQAVQERLRIGPEANIYLKGSLSVLNNEVNLNIESAEVNRFPVPQSLIESNIDAIEAFVKERIRAVPGLSIESLTVEDGQVKYKGTVPAIEETIHQEEVQS